MVRVRGTMELLPVGRLAGARLLQRHFGQVGDGPANAVPVLHLAAASGPSACRRSVRQLRKLWAAWAEELSGQRVPATQERSTSRPPRSASEASSQCPLRERRRGRGLPLICTSNGPNRQRLSGDGAPGPADARRDGERGLDLAMALGGASGGLSQELFFAPWSVSLSWMWFSSLISRAVSVTSPYRGRQELRSESRLYTDTHAKFSRFANHPTLGAVPPCYENWWADHHWQGYVCRVI
jgi:hypothetical protein